MTIQEVVKSGKPFKRKIKKRWLHVGKNGFIYTDYGEMIALKSEDILADDWEVKEELLSCPFCGDKVKIIEKNYTFYVEHEKFNNCAIYRTSPFLTKETAIKAWNKRVKRE